MITPENVFQQIERLTEDIIYSGLCNHQNFPCIRTKKNGIEEISTEKISNNVFLKNIPYDQIYTSLLESKDYNLKMLDGAMIFLQYRFKKKVLCEHRLAFFPSPNLLEFQNAPEIYETDELYADILDKRNVTVPLRFDFDLDGGIAKPIEHPYVHMTIGQYKNCRIPVSAPLTPYTFLNFILNNFYHTASEKYQSQLSKNYERFEYKIFEQDKENLYFEVPYYP